jgi:perosamine synthetase
MFGPSPRLRLYTSPDLYLRYFGAVATGAAKQGGDVEELERALAAEMGVKHAVAMPLARIGIYHAIKHTIRPGQKVILSPYTIADVVNMVVCAGGVPVFADIDRESCNISADSIRSLIDGETGAVLVTHFYGNVADMDAISKVCDAAGVPIIEDAAQAFGGRSGNRRAGAVGHAGVLSFGLYKNINSFYGGAMLTDNDALAASVRREMADWPVQPLGHLTKKVVSALITDAVTWPLLFKTLTFRLFRWAFLNRVDSINNKLKIDVDPQLKHELPEEYRARLSPIQARLIMRQLPGLAAQTQARVRAARLYHEGLRDLPELILAPMREDGGHIYWYYPIQHAEREKLVGHVMRQGQDITMSYHRNCASMPCFAQFARDCPNAQATADSLIYLPTYPRYGEDEIQATVKAIRSYFGR